MTDDRTPAQREADAVPTASVRLQAFAIVKDWHFLDGRKANMQDRMRWADQVVTWAITGVVPTEKDPSTLYCSFCGKSQHEVGKLIAGPHVFICNECVDLSHEIVHEADAPSPLPPAPGPVPDAASPLGQTSPPGLLGGAFSRASAER